jgi:L-iditol 2-dehydrogenase
MKAAVVTAKDKIEIKDVPVPALEPDSILVKVEAAGICNTTDSRILHAEDPTKVWPNQKWPFIMGHEICGSVVKVGTEVKGWQVGERFAGCGPHQGGYAEYCLVHPAKIAAVKVPSSMNSTTGALLESAMGAMRYFMRDNIHKRLEGARSAYIAGLGPSGLVYLMECLCMGIKTVYVSGNHETRRKLARELGATEVFQPDENPAGILSERGVSVDLAIDTTGRNMSGDFLKILRRGGVIVPFGVGYDWKENQKELSAIDVILADGAHAEAAKAAPFIFDWLISGKMPLEKIVTRIIALEELADAFVAIEQRKEIKVVVKF